MPRSPFGGRHELGQNFLHHRPTIARVVDLVRPTTGAILEIGAGDGALTRELARLGRPLTAIDIDPRRVHDLGRSLRGVRVEHADVLRHPLDAPVVVGNVPFHLTTPILRRLLARPAWRHAVLLTQWEVARKRAGVGGGTMMTAQCAPWFAFRLEGRVPAWCFAPRPSVDGGLLAIDRRRRPLVPATERVGYERFIRVAFTGQGGRMRPIARRLARGDRALADRALAAAGVAGDALPRDLAPEQWAALWTALKRA